MAFDKVEKWAPAAWYSLSPRMGHEEALEFIYCQAQKISGLEIVRIQEALGRGRHNRNRFIILVLSHSNKPPQPKLIYYQKA